MELKKSYTKPVLTANGSLAGLTKGSIGLS